MGVRLAWAAALALYAACWVLPILEDAIGFDGARFAHEEFWRLLTEGRPIDSVGDVFVVVFFAIGWLANELFLLGVATLLKWPRAAVRCLAFSLGIMVSWQIAFVEEFPLLIGYWFWVAAGAIMLWLAAARLAGQAGRGLGAVLAEPLTLALLLVPALNAAAARALAN
ncbi:MAG: hypothetical protein OEM59_14250 [Rhodospirillales bacterium]|nr:hypothetical protein [Rhodospirillales bacterium]